MRDIDERTEEYYKALYAALEVYKHSSGGGSLHIVLDDGNVDSHYITWCIDEADLQWANGEISKEQWYVEITCAKLLLELSMEERELLYEELGEILHRKWRRENGEPEV